MKTGAKARLRVRSTLASALMLWCAGAGCMLVSYAHGAAMSGANLADSHSNKRKLTDVSASIGAHACCKTRHSSSRRTVGQTELHLQSSRSFQQVALAEVPDSSGATSCCPLTSGSFVVTSRTQLNDDSASRADQSGSFSLTLTDSQSALRFYPLRLPDQNQTYLRGCVFLI
jgi:hypothetical protein